MNNQAKPINSPEINILAPLFDLDEGPIAILQGVQVWLIVISPLEPTSNSRLVGVGGPNTAVCAVPALRQSQLLFHAVVVDDGISRAPDDINDGRVGEVVHPRFPRRSSVIPVRFHVRVGRLDRRHMLTKLRMVPVIANAEAGEALHGPPDVALATAWIRHQQCPGDIGVGGKGDGLGPETLPAAEIDAERSEGRQRGVIRQQQDGGKRHECQRARQEPIGGALVLLIGLPSGLVVIAHLRRRQCLLQLVYLLGLGGNHLLLGEGLVHDVLSFLGAFCSLSPPNFDQITETMDWRPHIPSYHPSQVIPTLRVKAVKVVKVIE